MKTCPSCYQDLPVRAFGPDRRTADGHHATCRRCRNQAARQAHPGHGGARPS